MIHQVKAAGGIPQVGDCSGYEGASNPKRYFSVCCSSGIIQVCEEEKVEILHLSAQSVDAKNAGYAWNTALLVLFLKKESHNSSSD